MRRYKVGNPVVVIGGKYKGKTGQYFGKVGKVMCAVVIQGPPMSIINIRKSSIRPVDRVGVPDQTNHNSHIIVNDNLSSLSLAQMEGRQNLLDLTIHLCKTQEILKEEWFRGKHILESNEALHYDGIRFEMKLNIGKSYNLVGKAIDSLQKNLLELESGEVQMPRSSCIDFEEYSVGSY